jgi:hypothetical protein
VSTRKIGVLVTLGVLLVAGVMLVAFFVPGEFVTRAIAVLGVLIAVAKTAYDIVDKERERRKKASEGVERIKATVCYSKAWSRRLFGVEIYNEGPLVNIKSVCLKVVTGEKTERIPLLVNYRLEGAGQHFPRAKFEETYILQQKSNVFFHIDPNREMAAFLNFDPSALSVEVESFVGPLATIEGDKVYAVLKEEDIKITETRAAEETAKKADAEARQRKIII